METIEVELDSETHSLLEKLAKGEGWTTSELVKKIIAVYVTSVDVATAALDARQKKGIAS